jgi:copper chaperone
MSRQDITISARPETSAASGCGCGCGNADNQSATTEESSMNDTSPNSTSDTAAYSVSGMTCGHCASAVTEELRRLDGVIDVAVELNPGALSTVTITSTSPIAEDAVRSAVDEAGYELAGERT